MGRWIGADEASRRLGVKPATLYAYVSRGVLARRKGDDGRSVFDSEEIERLALRGRPRHRPGAASELVIESAVTLLGPDRAYYRGRDAIDLAATATFEAAATWLWTGDPAAGAAGLGAEPVAVAAARAAQDRLPPGVLPLERLQVITTTLAAADPVRLTLDPEAVIRTGRSLIAGLIDALPNPSAVAVPGTGAVPGAGSAVGTGSAADGGGAAGGGGAIAWRLWEKLAAPDADPALADVLRFAMVLLADHELAASTLAARVAASVRADPYAVVAAGLGVTSGALHGGASLGVEAMLAEATDPSLAGAVMGQRLRRGERIPGFGHAVYKSGDARATALLDRIRAATRPDPSASAPPSADPVVAAAIDPVAAAVTSPVASGITGPVASGITGPVASGITGPVTSVVTGTVAAPVRAGRVGVPHPALAVADAILAEAGRRHLPHVNVDFALGLLTTLAGMPRGAGEAIFAVARTAGWLAHAMEEYAHPTRLRLRASYTGPLA
ncbi:citrate/2-methylcitrate synthase [Dactylosporangium siamense]|uniref:citrate/2-methylcitrate synthase n=1 Tax=Dactylosporangium siamense TaxID=685454 RepID=UPI0036091B03